MFDEHNNEMEEELEDIIEQPIEEESCEGDSEEDILNDGTVDAGYKQELLEFRAQKQHKKEELMQLKTQMLEMKEELARKTSRIETIRDTLKVNKVTVEGGKRGNIFDIDGTLEDNDQDGGQQKEPDQANDDSIEIPDDLDDDDLVERPDLESAEEDGFLEGAEDDDDSDDYGLEYEHDQAYRDQFDQDPQVIKLNDKIKLFRHRCVASLGNNLYERALEFLQ